MILRNEIIAIVKSGIRHIAGKQLPDGSFPSLSSPWQNNFSAAFLSSTTFFTSAILSCLAGLPHGAPGHHAVAAISLRAAAFLLTQKNERWSWNYWALRAPERVTVPYPDDLDDTFTALVALVRHDRKLIDGKVLAAAAKLLTGTELREGGPYRTWLVRPEASPQWQDIDLAANSAVGYFLLLAADIHLPNLEQLVDDAFESDRLSSPYYPGICHVIYFISRFYKGRSREAFCKLLLKYQKENNISMTPIERAMTISSLINFGFPEKIPQESARALTAIIHKEGWQPYAFCIDPARNGKTFYGGSSAITAALCIEALAAYVNTSSVKGITMAAPSLASKEYAFAGRVRMLAKNACSDVNYELSGVALSRIEKMSDPGIVLLGYQFGKNLIGIRKKDGLIEQLALANLYGWIAYRIYDDFLDEEGDPALLACANFFLRKLTGIYCSLEKEVPGISNLFEETMNTVDGGNAWEQAHCRVPRERRLYLPEKLPSFGPYKNLSDRSFGHAMGPLTLLLAAGHKRTSQEYISTAKFFRHYLIARQLHDDAHDWAGDLVQGQINSVGALVLQDYQGKSSELIAGALPKLRHLFWTKIINDVLQIIHTNIAAARKARQKINILKDGLFLEKELMRLDRSAQKTLEERDRALEFLIAYSKPIK